MITWWNSSSLRGICSLPLNAAPDELVMPTTTTTNKILINQLIIKK